MNQPRHVRAALLFAAGLLVAGGRLALTAAPAAQTAPAAGAATAPLGQTLPLTADVTAGTLPNGMHYYLRSNGKPERRAELRLVVNAGSNLETDDQRGLAHFVEHMAFGGTTHFPGQQLESFLESVGMRFGQDLNAYTSFDETVYMLEVPTDSPAVLDKAFLVLEDWAHNVSFDPAEVVKQQGVITEEWRLGRGASTRLRDKQFPVLLAGSRYAERLPIGDMNVVQHATRDQLLKFYSTWYRPDLMSVVAVGDFDRAAVEAAIKTHLGAVPAAASPTRRPIFDVPPQPGTRYAIATDPEAAGTSVAVYHVEPAADQTTVGAYRQQLVESLFSSMLSARLSELSQKPDAPFVGAGAGHGEFVRTADAWTVSAVVKDGGVPRGLDALFTEAARVSTFGFTATELDRQRQQFLAGIDHALADKNNEESADLADELVRHATDREPVPGLEYEAALYHRFLPEITLADVNALAKTWMPDASRVVVVSAPDKPGVAVPDAAALASVLSAAAAKSLTPYVDTVDAAPLLPAAPTPGTIDQTSVQAAFGITEWDLSNGVRVVLKPTTFKDDEILFRASAPGGTSLASDADLVPAQTATMVVSAGGLGAFSAVDLRKRLAGKVVSVTPSIGRTDETVSGSSSRADLETMFQLIYLTMTAPRADPAMFQVVTTQLKTLLAHQADDPGFAFGETLTSVLTQDSPRARPLTAAVVDEMSLDKSLAFYRDRFADASGFTFTFVGSFDVAALKPLVERYLASLPSTGGHETWKDEQIRPPRGVVEKQVTKGVEPKSETAIVFTGPFQYDQHERVAIRAMAEVLETRLRNKIREELGGTYDVSVSPDYSKVPDAEYRLTIDFSSSPARTADLIKTAFAEIERFKTDGPTAQETADEREALLRDAETNARQNSYLVSQISLRYEYGEPVDSLFGLADYYRAITPDVIKAAAARYLDTGNYVQVVLMPEKSSRPE